VTKQTHSRKRVVNSQAIEDDIDRWDCLHRIHLHPRLPKHLHHPIRTEMTLACQLFRRTRYTPQKCHYAQIAPRQQYLGLVSSLVFLAVAGESEPVHVQSSASTQERLSNNDRTQTSASIVFNHCSVGISTSSTTNKSPFSSGCLKTGIPSPLRIMVSFGRIIFPGGLDTRIPRPSIWVTNMRENPRRASESVILTVVSKSFPERSNESWGCVCRTKITSPGGTSG
jgi:hypothetical protein